MTDVTLDPAKDPTVDTVDRRDEELDLVLWANGTVPLAIGVAGTVLRADVFLPRF